MTDAEKAQILAKGGEILMETKDKFYLDLLKACEMHGSPLLDFISFKVGFVQGAMFLLGMMIDADEADHLGDFLA